MESPSLMCVFLALLLLSSAFSRISSLRLIEVRTKDKQIEPPLNLNDSKQFFRFDPSKSKQISWHPRVFSYEGFLSDNECDHLISLAHGTSNKVILSSGQDEIVSKIEERISLWTFLPIEYGEGIQIWHYGVHESKTIHSGNIIATVLIYLSNVTGGGEIVYPISKMKGKQIKVKAVKGSAILLFNLKLDGTRDESSMNEGSAVHEGAKWSAVKYIEVRSKAYADEKEEECTDEDENCPNWASIGECERNPVFMLGTPDYFGSCRKSCHAC